MSMTQEARQEVERLLRSGQKIQALKYLSDTYGVTLQEGKLLLEALENELQAMPATSANDIEQREVFEGDDRKEIEQLLRENKKLEAVKWLKTKYDLGLKEALERVEVIEREINPNAKPAGNGCALNVFRLVGSIFSLVGFIRCGFSDLLC